MNKWMFIAVSVFFLGACGLPKQQESSYAPSKEFTDYWYSGQAEISSFSLDQYRYGELRKGTEAMIFVTEPFSVDGHVKSDNPSKDPSSTGILKLNRMRGFVTGIYPYHLMTSVFAPVDYTAYPHALKVTTSAQEWCGQAFTQVTWMNGFRLQRHSYFEAEGEADLQLPNAWLEDELWTTIRMDPERLPDGVVKVIPGTMVQRFTHEKTEPKDATASNSVSADTSEFSLVYNNGQALNIRYRTTFPHDIFGWEEKMPDKKSGSGFVTTKATRMQLIKTDYWNRNHNSDRFLRDSLGLH